MPEYVRRPEWLRPSSLNSVVLTRMSQLMRGLRLHTVCESALCPNRTSCFAGATATFMILGDVCTRNCTFCAVAKGKPLDVDPEEPEHIVAAVKKLGIRYVVITSVTRDDLADGGASQFARTIWALHGYDPTLLVEVLVPDFAGSFSALKMVIDANPAVLNHNVETVPRLYREVRPEASYERSLGLLEQAKQLCRGLLTKSGRMVGLGETREETIQVMTDLRDSGCDILTIGQYLAPSMRHHDVVRYIPPQEFEEYQNIGKEMGFTAVFSGPLVRSSFHASEAYQSALSQHQKQIS